jgi:hypothetical protein
VNVPPYFPTWMYLYFASLGTLALVLVAALFWTWMRSTRLSRGYLRAALQWNAVGYLFLFSAVWFACGIGAGPGFLLSTDPARHQPLLAAAAAAAGMFCSVLGWVCLLAGQRRLLNGLESETRRA